jgi:hypothetical protein
MTTKQTQHRGTALKLSLLIPLAAAFGCGGPEPTPPGEPTETVKTSALTGSGLPNAAGWWSFDEKCTTTTVYDTLTLPAAANGTKKNGVACVEGQIGRAVSLDGVDDVVEIPDRANLRFTSAMTIAAWVKPISAAGFIAGKWESPNSYQLSLSAGKPVFSLTFPNGGSGTLVTVTGPTALPTTSYSHVAGVYDGTALRLYVNGAQVATVSRTGSMQSSTALVRVGKLPSGSAFKGSVDELRLYGVALSATETNRLANGLPHRRIRAVAVDPKLAGSTSRLHTQFPTWRTPEAVLQYWTDFVNAGAGQTVYLPEDGDYASAIKYLQEVPWNNTDFPGYCSYSMGNSLVVQTAEQYMTTAHPAMPGDIFRVFKSTNPSLPFDLVADANAQLFHELIVITPPDWGFGREGTMVANTNDGTAFASHDGLMRFSALQTNKKFMFHGVNFERDDRNLEQYMHRVEATMSHAYSPIASGDPLDACGVGGTWNSSTDVHDYQTPWDLFTTQDTEKVADFGDNYFVLAEANVGQAHRMPNTIPEYVRDQSDQVPSNYQLWSGFPQSYPLDLTRRNRRVMVSCETWTTAGCVSAAPSYDAWIWELRQVPKNDGTTDGRSNNWWKYITNANYQVGRGQANVTRPVVGPFHGAMDLTLTIQEHNILLRWKAEATQAGSYQVQWSTDRVNWALATTLAGSVTSWQDGRPAPGLDTFYRVKWINGATTLYSDVLGANVGGATFVDVNGGQRPVVGLSISLYQTGVPYVRWEIPNSCGLSNGQAHAPCALTGTTCASNVCRGGDGQRLSDYHDGLAHYQVQKREAGFAIIRTVNRKPHPNQYNHMNFTAADAAAASGAVSGYRVAAYQDDGSWQGLGSFYGQSDMVLAVPNQETVGY